MENVEHHTRKRLITIVEQGTEQAVPCLEQESRTIESDGRWGTLAVVRETAEEI